MTEGLNIFYLFFIGSWAVSQGIINGAHKIGDFLNWGTPKIINSMTPASQPTAVPSSVQKGVEIAETATSKAVQVTGFVGQSVNLLRRILATITTFSSR